jgi:hypothetical protein
MTGEFILLATYGIRPMATDDPYIKRTDELVTATSEHKLTILTCSRCLSYTKVDPGLDSVGSVQTECPQVP